MLNWMNLTEITPVFSCYLIFSTFEVPYHFKVGLNKLLSQGYDTLDTHREIGGQGGMCRTPSKGT